MLCIVSLIIFAVLGIFSARYRPLAKEAFNCTFRLVTLRPCESGLDRRIKMALVVRTSKKAPFLSGFVYKHFSILSMVFTIIFFASLLIAANGLYNYFIHGSCDPNGGVCVLNGGK